MTLSCCFFFFFVSFGSLCFVTDEDGCAVENFSNTLFKYVDNLHEEIFCLIVYIVRLKQFAIVHVCNKIVPVKSMRRSRTLLNLYPSIQTNTLVWCNAVESLSQIHIGRLHRYIHMNQPCIFKQVRRYHLKGHPFEKLLSIYVLLYIHCNNNTKIIYPLFKDQLFGGRNSPVINSCPFITGLCVWHV